MSGGVYHQQMCISNAIASFASNETEISEMIQSLYLVMVKKRLAEKKNETYKESEAD